MSIHPSYQKLIQRSNEIALLSSSSAVLGWDQETYMPAKAIDWRAEQLAYLSGLAHKLFTSAEVGDWIKSCEDSCLPPTSDEAINLQRWRKDYDRSVRLPQELVEDIERSSSTGRMAWMEARKQKNFSLYRPSLEKMLSLKKKVAELWGYQESPYDPLLDAHEPGMTASQVAPLLDQLKQSLVKILPLAQEKSSKTDRSLLKGHYPIAEQQKFNRRVAEAFGFDFEAGRIDTTTHPFCSGMGPKDCRLTTRYDESYFLESLYGIMHETGHGLYDQGIEENRYGTPLGEAVSLGIHESQSRLWENHIGRSVEFWEHWLPLACEHFPSLKKFTPDQIAASAMLVQPSYIRTEADEVTYDLHIILRFEIERDLLEGKLSPANLPERWNASFEKLLGLPVKDDALGCLQDIHWSMGGLGYFPTYTLGNLNASQLHHAAEKEISDLPARLKRGEYAPLLQWLRKNIHRHGRRYLPGELIRQATGETLNPAHHVTYLKQKYT